MTVKAKSGATYDDLMKVADTFVAEIVEGDLFASDVLVPDLAGWRRESMPEYPMDVVGVEQAPEWLCEVVSPSTEARASVTSG